MFVLLLCFYIFIIKHIFTYHVSLPRFLYVVGCDNYCLLFLCCQIYQVLPNARIIRQIVNKTIPYIYFLLFTSFNILLFYWFYLRLKRRPLSILYWWAVNTTFQPSKSGIFFYSSKVKRNIITTTFFSKYI